MKARYIFTKCFLGNLFIKLKNRYENCEDFIKILVYHNIPFEDLGRFYSQIKYIAEHYGFIEPDDFKEVIIGQKQYKGIKVLLTFDDCFSSNTAVVEKILDPLGIKAFFFIPTGFIDALARDEQRIFIARNIYNNRFEPQNIPDDMASMTWADLEQLLKKGHTIGAHTINHCRLTEIENEDELRREITGSGDIIGEKLGIKINHFAFPFGGVNSVTKKAMDIIKERYKYCFSSIRGKNCIETNSYALLRDPVSLNDPLEYVRFIIEDGLGFFYKKQSLLLANIANG